jgi:hypothetical protein
MRAFAVAAVIFALTVPLRSADDKLTFDNRVELVRGLMAEYVTLKEPLPRSKKPLPFSADGTWDKQKWEAAVKEFGPAARVGDLVQITKVTVDENKITFEINGGLKSGRKWYDGIQVGMGKTQNPVSQRDITPTTGTTLELLFSKPVAGMKSADVKKILAPLFDFEKRTATELYAQSLPPEIQKAIADKHVLEGMDREQVLLAVGRPVRKLRETKDSVETEEWIYGQPPGAITFVTFAGNKVIKVKESYAGLGAEASGPPQTPR